MDEKPGPRVVEKKIGPESMDDDGMDTVKAFVHTRFTALLKPYLTEEACEYAAVFAKTYEVPIDRFRRVGLDMMFRECESGMRETFHDRGRCVLDGAVQYSLSGDDKVLTVCFIFKVLPEVRDHVYGNVYNGIVVHCRAMRDRLAVVRMERAWAARGIEGDDGRPRVCMFPLDGVVAQSFRFTLECDSDWTIEVADAKTKDFVAVLHARIGADGDKLVGFDITDAPSESGSAYPLEVVLMLRV